MALKSMTGYGRASTKDSQVDITVEILSVNRKHLDINVVMSHHLQRFDPEIRKIVANAIFRGHITLRMHCRFLNPDLLVAKANLALAKSYYTTWKEIDQYLGSKSSFDLSSVLKDSDMMTWEVSQEIDAIQGSLEQTLKAALDQLVKMREIEGLVLEKDIKSRLQILELLVEKLFLHSAKASSVYHAKLLDRLKLLLPELETKDERIAKEMALIADRMDITEEIVRFRSHLSQFATLLKSQEEAPGKKGDFILQELNREINTMGSKVTDAQASQLIIEVKGELERIREQIQNVE